MNRALAYAHLWIAASESASIVEKSLSAPFPLERCRLKLLDARKKLNAIAFLSLAMNWQKHYLDVLAPLDHACKSLDAAMQSKFIDRDGVQVALAMCKQALEIVSEKGGFNHVA